MDFDVVVIGAGHNGLVAAAYLAEAGLSVGVFERSSRVGGAAITEELWPGMMFSTCAHMVHGFHPRLIRDLGLTARGLTVLPREFSMSMVGDGTYWGPATYDSARNRTARLSPDERHGLAAYSHFQSRLRAMTAPYRLGPPPSLTELRSAVAGTEDESILERALTTRLSELQRELLPTDQLLDRAAGEFAAVGRDPLAFAIARGSMDEPDEATGEAPPHGYIQGGTGVLTKILADVATDRGVSVHLDQPVAEIMVESGRAVGLRLASGEDVQAKVVMSNADPKHTFLRLLSENDVPSSLAGRIAALKSDVSCYKLLAVASELPQWKDWDGDSAQPSTGGVTIGQSRARVSAAYDALEAGRPTTKPMMNFSVPSAVDASLAKDGYHTISCWIYPAPARLRSGDWGSVRDELAECFISEINEYAPNFRHSIIDYKLRTPMDIETENGLTDGCIWHLQHEADQLFWNRPLPEFSHYRSHLPGLYLCGSGQHPGGEISGLPGHNAAHIVLEDLA